MAMMWRVMIKEPTSRGRQWVHHYAVLAETEVGAKALAAEYSHLSGKIADCTVEAEEDETGVMKVASYTDRVRVVLS